jgi:hypothetical protein
MTTQTLSIDVRHLSVGELVDLFQTLHAPAIADMHGEYAARLLRQPGLLANLAGHGLLSNPVMGWLCKAFRPVDAERGRGYNTFRVAGRVVQRFPMQTRLAPSRYDGRPAYHLIYGAYRSLCGDIHMVDEVRQLAPGTYLGMGTWGFTDRQRRVALPFLLEGPVGAYRGDIGELRLGFQVSTREIPRL